MKVLITGGAGYIGSVLIGELLKWEQPTQKFSPIPPYINTKWVHVVEKLTVVDTLLFNQNVLGGYAGDPRFQFVNADVQSRTLMSKLYEEHDVILPLAGLVGFPICSRFKDLAWAVNSDVVVEMMHQLYKGTRVIYPCTNSGYGSRPDDAPVTEEDPLNPISDYGKSKVDAEAVVLDKGGVSLRLATVMGYSPCMRLDLLVNTFVWKAVKERSIVLFEKDFRRNYIHVQDVCKAFMLALTKYDDMKGNAYNVGLSTANLTKMELATKIAEHTECHIVEAPFMEDPDKRSYLVSNAKIEALGFNPHWGIDATINQLVGFYKTVSLKSANIRYENWDF